MLSLHGLAIRLGLAIAAGPAESQSWLSWDAPASCPDASYVGDAVEERLGRAPSPDEVAVHATVVDDGPRGLHLDLATTPTGAAPDVRRLEAHDCHALADAAALLVALSVDPVAVAAISAARAEAHASATPDPVAPTSDPVDTARVPRRALESPRDASPPGDRASARDRADTTSEEPPSERQRSPVPHEVLLSVAGGPELGALPGVAGAASAAIGLGWSRVRLELGAVWIGLRTRDHELASVRVQLAAAVVRACARVGAQRVEVPLCGGVDFGAVRGDVRGGSGARSAIGPWIARAKARRSVALPTRSRRGDGSTGSRVAWRFGIGGARLASRVGVPSTARAPQHQRSHTRSARPHEISRRCFSGSTQRSVRPS